MDCSGLPQALSSTEDAALARADDAAAGSFMISTTIATAAWVCVLASSRTSP